MANISYTPNVQFTPYVDGVSLVQAGGPDGFNQRFDDIKKEFNQLSLVVQQVNNALASLGAQIIEPVTIGFTPVLLPYREGVPVWSPIFWSRVVAGTAQGTFVEKPATSDQAWGVLPINLPNGVNLKDIKVLGEQTGGEMLTEFIQELRTPPFTKTILVSVNGLMGEATPPTPIPGSPVYQGDKNLYYLLARVTGASGAAQVRLRSFQITYQP